MEQYKIVLDTPASYLQQWQVPFCSKNSPGARILTSLQHSSNP